MNTKLLHIWNILRNKYVLATIVFLLLFLFLDENNLMVTRRLSKDVAELRQRQEELQEGIIADSAQALALKSDLKAIERYGRETYYMKRADEDIYMIIDPEK